MLGAHGMKDWISAELAPWRAFGMGVEDLHRRLDEQAKEDPSVFIFHVDGGKVRFDDKRAALRAKLSRAFITTTYWLARPFIRTFCRQHFEFFMLAEKPLWL